MNVTEACYEKNMRIDKIIHVGAAIADQWSISDDLRAFIDSDMGTVEYTIFPGGDYEPDNVSDGVEWLMDKTLFGFLIRVSTPYIDPKRVLFDDKGEYGGHSYSWGCTRERWFYAETFDKAVTNALSWATEVQDASIEAARSI